MMNGALNDVADSYRVAPYEGGLPESQIEAPQVERAARDKASERGWRSLMPSRRGPVVPLPGLSQREAAEIQDELFEVHGLSDHVGCSTAEPSRRSIPHTFRESEVANLTRLMQKWMPIMMRFAMKRLLYPIQAYNTTSRQGWPESIRPQTKEYRQVVLDWHINNVLTGGLDFYRPAFITAAVRLQDESAKRIREFTFLDADGTPYRTKVDRRDDLVLTEAGERVPSRPRPVYNFPMTNMVTQVLDTAIHNVWLAYPLCHHNINSRVPYPETNGKNVYALDIKHFERYTYTGLRERAIAIGGLYQRIHELNMTLPFVCIADNWKRPFLVTPDRSGGWIEQFASGHSAVSALNKETMIAIFSEYHTTLGYTEDAALQVTLAGGEDGLKILNGGDDNFVFYDDRKRLDDMLSFLSSYVPTEEETPARFYGGLWDFDSRVFRPDALAYLRHTYLPERGIGPPFRRWPAFGWMSRRNDYAKGGAKGIQSIYDDEDAALSLYGVPWLNIVTLATREQRDQIDGIYRDQRVVDEKLWMLSEEEKLRTGLFVGYGPDKTKPIVDALISDENRKLLTIRN